MLDAIIKAAEEGVILIHEDIREHWLWKNAQALKVWIGILFEVCDTDKRTEWPEFYDEPIVLYPGEIYTSNTRLAKALHTDTLSLDKYLKAFEKGGLIKRSEEYGEYILTVVNWCAESEVEEMERSTGQRVLWCKAGYSASCNKALKNIKKLAAKGGEV